MESKEKAQQEEKSKSEESAASQPSSTMLESETKTKGKAPASDHDLDVFLLGDGSSDEGPGWKINPLFFFTRFREIFTE